MTRTRPHHWLTILGTGLALAVAVQLLLPPGGLPALAGQVVGYTPADVSYANTAPVTCTGTSGTLYAASSGAPREVTVSLLAAADTGIHVGFGATATSSMFLIQPGQAITFNGRQSITCIRAGSANVTAYLLPGSYAGWVP
jgi:hypothetical protein